MSDYTTTEVDKNKAGAADPNLASALAALLKNHSGLAIRLKEIPFDWQSGSHRLSGKFHYITFSDGVPTVAEFVQYLYDCLIPYCIPRRLIKAAADQAKLGNYIPIVRLNDEARNLFIKARNQLKTGGEPGEVILYALLEWALQAPNLVSKMYLKTNNNMPIHGTDGIHLGYDPDSDLLSVYFGESKLFKNFAEAADAAFKSIAELISNQGQILREIQILNNMSDLDALSEPFRNKIIEYINPYSASDAALNKRVVHACLLGFEYKAYKKILSLKPTEVLAAFEAKYQQRIAAACRVIERQYTQHLPETTNLHIFLLPFPSLETFRSLFFQKIGTNP